MGRLGLLVLLLACLFAYIYRDRNIALNVPKFDLKEEDPLRPAVSDDYNLNSDSSESLESQKVEYQDFHYDNESITRDPGREMIELASGSRGLDRQAAIKMDLDSDSSSSSDKDQKIIVYDQAEDTSTDGSQIDSQEMRTNLATPNSNDNNLTARQNNTLKNHFKFVHEGNHLEITASRILEIDDDVLDNLITDLKTSISASQFQELRSFTLFLWRCEKITDVGIEHLSYFMQEHTLNLTSLTLSFNSLKLITNEGVKNIALYVLKYHTKLEILVLDFFNCPEISDQSILRLSSSISRFQTNLQSLSLIFSRCTQITDQGFNYATSQALINLRNLKTLSISFGRTSISDAGLIQLGLDLSRFGESLDTLKINIYGCESISDTGFKALSFDIGKSLKQLKHLEFSVWDTQISSKAKKVVKTALRSLPYFKIHDENDKFTI